MSIAFGIVRSDRTREQGDVCCTSWPWLRMLQTLGQGSTHTHTQTHTHTHTHTHIGPYCAAASSCFVRLEPPSRLCDTLCCIGAACNLYPSLVPSRASVCSPQLFAEVFLSLFHTQRFRSCSHSQRWYHGKSLPQPFASPVVPVISGSAKRPSTTINIRFG